MFHLKELDIGIEHQIRTKTSIRRDKVSNISKNKHFQKTQTDISLPSILLITKIKFMIFTGSNLKKLIFDNFLNFILILFIENVIKFSTTSNATTITK